MTEENRRHAVTMAASLSGSLIAASLAMITVEVGYATFLLDRYAGPSPTLVLLGGSSLFLILGVIYGGKGVDLARKSGFEGIWSLRVGKPEFNLQATCLLIALVLFVLSIFAPTGQEVRLTERVVSVENLANSVDRLAAAVESKSQGLSTHVAWSSKVGLVAFIVASAVVCCVGLILALRKDRRVSSVGRLAFALGGFGVTFGSLFSLGGLRFDVTYQPSTQVAEVAIRQFSRTVVGFPVGRSDLPMDGQIESILQDLIRIPPEQVLSLDIIGGTDRRALLSGPREVYESNLNLGLARGLAVKEAILTHPALAVMSSKISVLSRGATFTGTQLSEAQMRQDRCVEIRVIWKAPTSETQEHGR